MVVESIHSTIILRCILICLFLLILHGHITDNKVWSIIFSISLFRFSAMLYYFATMLLFSVVFGLVCGTAGFLSSYWFVHKIYSLVKIDWNIKNNYKMDDSSFLMYKSLSCKKCNATLFGDFMIIVKLK